MTSHPWSPSRTRETNAGSAGARTTSSTSPPIQAPHLSSSNRPSLSDPSTPPPPPLVLNPYNQPLARTPNQASPFPPQHGKRSTTRRRAICGSAAVYMLARRGSSTPPPPPRRNSSSNRTRSTPSSKRFSRTCSLISATALLYLLHSARPRVYRVQMSSAGRCGVRMLWAQGRRTVTGIRWTLRLTFLGLRMRLLCFMGLLISTICRRMSQTHRPGEKCPALDKVVAGRIFCIILT